jgi:hypothetical protein
MKGDIEGQENWLRMLCYCKRCQNIWQRTPSYQLCFSLKSNSGNSHYLAAFFQSNNNLPWCGYPRCQVALKEVPASNEVLDSPFGIPHGGGVRTLSKKSRLRDLARGKSSLTWQFTQTKSCNKARVHIATLLPDASAMFKPVEQNEETLLLSHITKWNAKNIF